VSVFLSPFPLVDTDVLPLPQVIETKIKIDKLKFAVRESKHSTLINFLRPLATGLIKTAVTKAIEVAIRAALEQADQQISDILERIEDANSEEGTNKIDALKAHFNEKKQNAQATKEKAQQAARASFLSLSCLFPPPMLTFFLFSLSRRQVRHHPQPG
jgi:hypothetical protein